MCIAACAARPCKFASGVRLPPGTTLSEPWGVLMEMVLANGSATVVALADGNASIYLSGGGGFLGGRTHDAIRKAAQKAVAVAAEFQSLFKATTTFPMPQAGQITFYVLTDSGVLTPSAPVEDLRKGRHPLSKLADAVQDVITQYRLTQEGK